MSINYANIALQAGMSGNMGSVWSAGGGYNRMRWQGYPDFLTDDQKCRLERIRQARMLLDGQHEQYWLDEGRTRFHFPYDNINGVITRMYLTFNLVGLASFKIADLLFGQLPLLDTKNPAQYAAVEALGRRTQLHAVLMNAAVNGSAFGESFLEAVIADFDGKVYCREIPAEEIFPIGEVREDGQYASYVRYKVKNVGTRDVPIWLLLETYISAGRMDRMAWQLIPGSGAKAMQLALDVWDPALKGQDSTPTGIRENTIVWVPTHLGKAKSDYDCAITQQDKFNADNTRVGRILQKHSNPKVGFPKSMADPHGNVPAAADAFFVDDMTQLPKYVTWDANLEHAIKDRAFTLNQLLVRMEMSPVLLGLKEGAAPDAYKKVRLEAFNSITAAGRKAILWTAAVQRLLDVAQALDNTRPGVSYPFGENAPIGVTLRDGIPVDEGEQATNIATLRSAGAMSRYRAVKQQLGDASATDAEVAQIEQEETAAAPSVNVTVPAGRASNSKPTEVATPNTSDAPQTPYEGNP